jgi:hypothetical protein
MPFPRPTTALTVFALLIGGTALAVAAPAGASDHTVAPGETLSGIAERYCTSVRDLAARNGVDDPHTILAGARLDVGDACGSTVSAAGAVVSHEAEIGSHRYLVATHQAAADEFDVPGDLRMALTFTESRWRSDRVSAAGAVGVGQILPATASWLRGLMDEPDLDESEPVDNVRMSARLLRFLLDRTADDDGPRPRVALAAYFQGIGDVLRNGVDRGGDHYADVVLEHRGWFADL